jgi:outer membrane receptor protein involved in Fe transport
MELLESETQEQTPTTEFTFATFKTTRIVNTQSVEGVSKGELLFIIQHRFGSVNQGIYEFFGLDQANIRLVDERNIHNAGISIYPVEFATFTFEVRNIADEQVSDVLGFPLPGRSYFGTVSLEF